MPNVLHNSLSKLWGCQSYAAPHHVLSVIDQKLGVGSREQLAKGKVGELLLAHLVVFRNKNLWNLSRKILFSCCALGGLPYTKGYSIRGYGMLHIIYYQLC